MGLTIHYALKSKLEDAEQVKLAVHLIAAFAGGLSDALAGSGMHLEAPMRKKGGKR